MLRCLHWGMLAAITPKGLSTPFVGDRCGHGHRAYQEPGGEIA